MNDYIFSFTLLICSAAFGWLMCFLVLFLLKKSQRVLKRFKTELSLLQHPLLFLMPTLCVMLTVPLLRFPNLVQTDLAELLRILLISTLGWFFIKIVYVVRDMFLNRYNANARALNTQIRIITHIVVIVIIIVAGSLTLMTFPAVRQLGLSLLASAGIVGVAIGFAAQKTLGNLIAGIQIAFAQPIRLDDVVIVEGEWGVIEEITLTFVVVHIWDQRRLILPISYFLEKPFQNWTRTSAELLGTVLIYVDYTFPVMEIRNELTHILENNPLWDKKVSTLQVTNATDKTVELRAVVSAQDSSALWDLRCDVREQFLSFLQQRFPDCLPRIRMELNQEGTKNENGLLSTLELS